MKIEVEPLDAIVQASEDDFLAAILSAKRLLPRLDAGLLVIDLTIARYLKNGELPYSIRRACAENLLSYELASTGPLASYHSAFLQMVCGCETQVAEALLSLPISEMELTQLSRMAALDAATLAPEVVAQIRRQFTVSMHSANYRQAATCLICLAHLDSDFTAIYRQAYKHLCFIVNVIKAEHMPMEMYLLKLAFG